MAHHEDYNDDNNLIDSEADRQYLTELQGNRRLGEVAEPHMELDDLTATLEQEGIDITPDGEMPSQRRRSLPQLDDSEDVGEIEIAKRFERGHFRALKAISRSPLAIREVMALGSDLERGVRSIKDVVVFDEEDVTDEIVAKRLEATLGHIRQMATHYKKACAAEEKIKGISRTRNPKLHRRCRWNIARHRVEVSRILRKLRYTQTERKRLIARVTGIADTMRSLERQSLNLGKKADTTRNERLRVEYKRQQLNCAADLKKLEEESGVG